MAPGSAVRCIAPLLVTLGCVALGCAAPPARGPTAAPEGAGLAVGFRHGWILDEGRAYRTAFDGGATYGARKSPRPILALVWYPAVEGGEPMTHGDYFAIESDDPRLAPLSRALSSYARGVFCEQVVGRPEAELGDAGRAELERALARPAGARRGASPAAGPFPLVVYHSGAGSSFEDNARLCERLATRGYVVLSSAYLEADGSSLNVDAERGSAADAQGLVRFGRGLPFADKSALALVGHSAGAQALLMLAAQPGCAADALVLLDTTQDYYGLGLPLHETLVREASAHVDDLVLPMLVAASPEAVFALCDTLVGSERTYLTVPEVGHDEYISQGLQRLERIEGEGAASADAGDLARAPAVRAAHAELEEAVLAFLDAELRGRREAFDALLARDAAAPWSHERACLVRVPRGASGPEPYDPGSDAPPTPRQFARLVLESTDEACSVLERFAAREPRGPLYTSTMMAGSLLWALSESGRAEDARLYQSALEEIPLRALGLFEFLADISAMQGEHDLALRFVRFASGLDPDDEALAKRLSELEGRAGR